jgi:hypothetical protein
VQPLFELLLEASRRADQASVENRDYLELFGFPHRGVAATMGNLWRHLYDTLVASDAATPTWARQSLEVILEQGPLARRILGALDEQVSRERIASIYRELANCLSQGRMFAG